MAWDLFSCQCLWLSSHAASLGGGNSCTEANDEHYSLSWFCWEGSAVQELWGSNWSTKNKEQTCYSAWERNEKINGRREFRCVGECWWLKFQPAWEIVFLLVLLSQLEFLWDCCSEISNWMKLTEAQKGVFLAPDPTYEGRECGRCWLSQDMVSCCFQIHLYSSVILLSACKGGICSQCSLLNSGIHLSFLFTKSRYNDFEVKW